MKKILPLLLVILFLAGCKNTVIPYDEENISAQQSIVTSMTVVTEADVTTSTQNADSTVSDEETLKKKLAGLFIVKPESLTGSYTEFSDSGKANSEKYPVCGIIFFKDNITDKEQTNALISDFKETYGSRLWVGVDMEGGVVNRFPRGTFSYMQISAFDMAQENTPEEVGNIYYKLGNDLKTWGFNLNFAPDADIFSNPANTVIGHRAFGTTAETVSEYAAAAAAGLQNSGVMPVIKHFPGHGDVAGDTHKDFVVEDKTLEELKNSEIIPFADILGGADYEGGVMVAHIECPNVTGNDLPSSLSPVIIDDVLRNQLNFGGVVFTDSLEMGAIENEYGAGDAAVLAISAGADVLLMPPDLEEAVNAIYEAITDGTLSESRIDESLSRISYAKALYF